MKRGNFTRAVFPQLWRRVSSSRSQKLLELAFERGPGVRARHDHAVDREARRAARRRAGAIPRSEISASRWAMRFVGQAAVDGGPAIAAPFHDRVEAEVAGDRAAAGGAARRASARCCAVLWAAPAARSSVSWPSMKAAWLRGELGRRRRNSTSIAAVRSIGIADQVADLDADLARRDVAELERALALARELRRNAGRCS